MALTLVLMGTAAFAVPALNRLADSEHDLVAVYTQPPRPAGRGKRDQRTPVHDAADALGVPVLTPKSLKNADAQRTFAALGGDLAVVAAYGLILPQAILNAPRLGCINLHGSLLPRWRGAAPVERAILAGDRQTGVGIFQMEAGLDTGPVFTEAVLTLDGTETGVTVRERLAELAADRLMPLLADLESGRARAVPQGQSGVTYAQKIDKTEYRIDWQSDALGIDRQVRAFWPFAWFESAGTRIRVLRAAVAPGLQSSPPGTVVDHQLTIACGTSALQLLEVQPAGKRAMDAASFLRGHDLVAGTCLT